MTKDKKTILISIVILVIAAISIAMMYEVYKQNNPQGEMPIATEIIGKSDHQGFVQRMIDDRIERYESGVPLDELPLNRSVQGQHYILVVIDYDTLEVVMHPDESKIGTNAIIFDDPNEPADEVLRILKETGTSWITYNGPDYTQMAWLKYHEGLIFASSFSTPYEQEPMNDIPLLCGPGTTLENGICVVDVIHPDERGSMPPTPEEDKWGVGLQAETQPDAQFEQIKSNHSGISLDRTMYLPPGFVTYTDINGYQPVWTLHADNFEAYTTCKYTSESTQDYNWCQAFMMDIEDHLGIDK